MLLREQAPLKDMGSLKFELALVPYTAAITACASAKQWQEALNLLAALGDGVDEMAYSPSVPNSPTF